MTDTVVSDDDVPALVEMYKRYLEAGDVKPKTPGVEPKQSYYAGKYALFSVASGKDLPYVVL